ncbi:MAG: bicyclomycin resistance protein, partial [Limnohabitans sp.]
MPFIFKRSLTLVGSVLILIGLWSSAVSAQSRNPADLNKILRVAFPVAETGFDPVRVNDVYSNTVTAAIFQSLVTYDWMAKPNKVVPDAAAAMPEITE